MSWQLACLAILALVLLAGGVWFERSRPTARILAAVAALAALGVAGRLLFAPLPNVVATTDVALLAGYTLGGPPGFAVGALSALVSNIWLGQGPWTPWQMAGWGLVGIGGAALAVASGRRLGRVGLAAAAALAGLLYGALLDLSAMVNFGGEQSLDRYLALSARGIPFNITHAVGNAALMLAAGPALVRMLDRYRERFQISWERGPSPERDATVAALAIGLALALATLQALGGAPERAAGAEPQASPAVFSTQPAARAATTKGARRWLVSAQNRDGGFGISAGASSNPGMTGWAMLGLEAVGVNPRDVRRGGRSPVSYLRRNAAQLSSNGDLELTILALHGAGLSAASFAGRDLVAELRSRQRSNGSYARQVNQTAFAILARRAAGESAGSLRRPARWLEGVQNGDGGWGSVASAPSEPDSTGAALQALAPTAGKRVLAAGADWLRDAQHRDGGWSLSAGAASNSQSAAWAIQGLLAAGVEPGRVHSGERDGLEYLGARQRGDGHYSYSKSSDQTPVWVTAQALAARALDPYPVAPVPRRPASDGAGSGSGSSAEGGSARGSSAAGAGNGAGGGPSNGDGNRNDAVASGSGSEESSPEGGDAGSGAGDGGADAVGALQLPGAQASAVSPSQGAGSGGVSPALIAAIAAALAAAAAGVWRLRRQGWF